MENISGWTLKTMLPKDMADGEVFKIPLVKTDTFEVNILEVLPGARIKEHVHANDSELYAIYGQLTEKRYCKKGSSHGFRNSSFKTVIIVAIKFFTDVSEEEANKIVKNFDYDDKTGS